MLFDRSGTKTTYGALIDVASGTIGIAIVASDAVKKLPEIIYENRIDMRVGKRAAAEIRRVREMLLSASLSFSEGFASLRAIDPRARVSSLSVTVAAPWSYTVTNAVEYKDDAPFKITPTMLRDLVDSAEATILEGMRKDPDAAAENLEIIERVTTNVTVNDYPVPDPLKVEGTSLALSHVVGLVPRDILTSVHEIQDKLFQGTTLRVHTSMCTLFAVAEELYPRLSSFCLVNVSGEATEFGIATEGTLTDSIFIPKGTNGFMKKVMEDTGRPLADVESALRAFGAKDAAMASDLEAHLS
ncbi:MAG TPA: hypothetical protein VFS75_02405, partial [Candidatus Paceibacterota bacterium]|nr:hypothetical protein [Candidatus Paceibacterota bacterium]